MSPTTMSSLRRLHLLVPLSLPTISKLPFTAPLTPTSYHSHFSSSPQSLTEEELSKLDDLIPRLCHSNNLPTALRLTTTALLTHPPLHTLPLFLSHLITSLTSQPDMTHPMSLLTHLLHTPPSHPYIKPISLMLLSSYFHNRNPKHALKILRWLQRPGSPCTIDEEMYGVVVEGFCRNGVVFEGLVALKDMMHLVDVVGGGKLEAFCDSGEWVYRGLLREARVKEGMELKDALLGLARAEGKERVLVVLECIIAEWTE